MVLKIVKTVWPVMLTYVAIAAPCGMIMAQTGMEPWMVFALSSTFVTGSGQFMVCNLWLAGVPAAEQAKRCRDVLTQVGLLEYMKKYPKDLSGGMKQRVSFARTLLSGADMLLLDEPFSALDYLTRVEMQEWLLEQWEHYHKTILFITHDVEEAVFLSKKIFVIQDRPFSSMEMVEVPLPAHRDRNDLKKPEIVDLKERLIGKLRRSVRL